jgi:hypothetical protein
MKVEVDIQGLERKIAACNKKADYQGYEEGVQYYMGRCDAYMDILCGYLGVTGVDKRSELEQKIIEKYSKG